MTRYGRGQTPPSLHHVMGFWQVNPFKKRHSMKKQMMKMGLVAAMVMGAMSGAHAASQPKIDFYGSIVKTACDISMPDSNDSKILLGSWAADQFPDNATVLTDHAAPIILQMGKCEGADIPKGKTIDLTAEQVNANVPVELRQEGLWGDNDLGVGVDIKAGTTDGVTPPTYTDLTPSQGLTLYTNGSGGDVKPGSITTMPAFVYLKAGLRATTAGAAGAISSGHISSTLLFTAAYD